MYKIFKLCDIIHILKIFCANSVKISSDFKNSFMRIFRRLNVSKPSAICLRVQYKQPETSNARKELNPFSYLSKQFFNIPREFKCRSVLHVIHKSVSKTFCYFRICHIKLPDFRFSKCFVYSLSFLLR